MNSIGQDLQTAHKKTDRGLKIAGSLRWPSARKQNDMTGDRFKRRSYIHTLIYTLTATSITIQAIPG